MGDLRPGQRKPGICPATSSSTASFPPAGRTISQRLSAGRPSRLDFPRPAQPVANLQPLGAERRAAARQARSAQQARRERASADSAPTTAWKRRSPITSWRSACRPPCPSCSTCSGETEATKRLYGLDDEATRKYGLSCLMARRLVERGVRFIELTPPAIPAANRWDQHDKLKDGHSKNALACDKPIAGLLKDLKSRGLLDQTLVVWAGEFGRTPVRRARPPAAITAPTAFRSGWPAAASKADWSRRHRRIRLPRHRKQSHHPRPPRHDAAPSRHRPHRLTHRFGGRDMRLTDIYGEVVHGILA